MMRSWLIWLIIPATGFLTVQDLDQEALIGKWQTVSVEYLDQEPPNGREGMNLILEFREDGACINHEHQSTASYTIKGRIVDMGGYRIIVEKLSKNELVFREQKDFFIRRFYCKRI